MVAWALVVVGEAAGGRAHLELPARYLEPFRLASQVRPHRRAAARQPAQEQCLAHRLRVLELVANDELVELIRTHVVQYGESPVSDVRHVGQRPLAVEQLDVAAHCAWRLERVVGGRELLVQQRPAAQPVDRPQVLVRGDVREVPDQRAHDRVERAMDDVVVQAIHQGERRSSGVVQLRRQVEHRSIHGD